MPQVARLVRLLALHVGQVGVEGGVPVCAVDHARSGRVLVVDGRARRVGAAEAAAPGAESASALTSWYSSPSSCRTLHVHQASRQRPSEAVVPQDGRDEHCVQQDGPPASPTQRTSPCCAQPRRRRRRLRVGVRARVRTATGATRRRRPGAGSSRRNASGSRSMHRTSATSAPSGQWAHAASKSTKFSRRKSKSQYLRTEHSKSVCRSPRSAAARPSAGARGCRRSGRGRLAPRGPARTAACSALRCRRSRPCAGA